MKEPNQPPPHVPGKGAMYLFGDVIDKTPEPNPTPSGPVQIPTIGEQIGLTPPQPAPKPESDEWFDALGDEIEKHPIAGPPKPATAPGSGLWTDSKPLNLGEEDSWRPRDDGGWETEAEDGRTQIWTPTEGYNFGTGPWAQPAQAPAPDRHEASRAAFESKPHFIGLRRANGTYTLPDEQAGWEAWCRALDHAAQEQRRPCGECHLQPGEVCDICGKQEQPAPAGSAVEEQSAVEWVNNKTTQCQHVPKRVNVVRTNYALALAYRFDELSAKFAEVERKRDSDHRTMEWITKNWQAAEAVAEERRAMGAEYIRDLSEFRDKLAAAERCVERLRGALERISRMDAETVGLHPQFYGHGAAIARAALAETKEDHANG